MRARLLAAVAAVLTIVGGGLVVAAPPASAQSYTIISGAGSTWAGNAINSWIDSVSQNGLTVNYAADGDTAGRQLFKSGAVNFAASEIPYGVPDMNGAADPNPTRGYAYVPDVAGGLAFMYNLVIGGRRVTNLRLGDKTIADIFTGKITYWDDPEITADNPDIALPHIPIIPVVRSDGSGATAEFTQWILATDPSAWQYYCGQIGVAVSDCIQTSTWPVDPRDPQMVAQAGDAGVSGYVAQNSADGAIGYTPYSYALSTDFPVAKVLNAAGYYTSPTPGNVGVSLLNAQINEDTSSPLYLTANLSQVYADTDPRTYELSYYSYLIVPTDSTPQYPLTTNQGYSVASFGAYALCQGQQQVDNLGYSALPINLVEAGYAQLAQIPGAELPATTSAFIQGCNNPTFSPNGTNTLAANDPQPQACDQQGTTQCAATNAGAFLTETTVTASPTPAAVGQPVTLTAMVTVPDGVAAVPAGSVQFDIGPPNGTSGVFTALGSPVALNPSGVATVTETFLTAGDLPVIATFTPADPTAFDPSYGQGEAEIGPQSYVSGQAVTTTVLPSGTFSFTPPATGTITLTPNGDTATGSLANLFIDDTRNTYPGWSVTGQATDFTNPASQPAGDISGNQLGWAPNSPPLADGAPSLADGAFLGDTVAPDAPGLGKVAAVLAYANPGTGFGDSTLEAGLTFDIPSTAPSGEYTSTLTLTADPSGP